MEYKIPFNKPTLQGTELKHIDNAIRDGHLCGDGAYTKKCQELLEKHISANQVLLTPSCTAALEIAALLCDLKEGDEVILPSYTFVSTANAFALRGAKLRFIDIRRDTMNLDENLIEEAITEHTKAIVPVHYAGVACEMDRIKEIANKHGVYIIEDAAQGVDAKYKNSYLGTLSDMGTYSFHETKNFVCGEGGALVINNDEFNERAEIIREKGTNRSKFFRGQVDKYTWVDLGSSYLLSEIQAAFLFGQLESMRKITLQRKAIFEQYYDHLQPLVSKGKLELPYIPEKCTTNYHMFYILLPDQKSRTALIKYLKKKGIEAVFHYIPLHNSPMAKQMGYNHETLPVTEEVSNRLLRLPFYNGLTESEINTVTKEILAFFMLPKN